MRKLALTNITRCDLGNVFFSSRLFPPPPFLFCRCVKGLHLNMCMSNRGFKVLLSLLIGPYLPFLVGLSREDVRRLFPFFEKNVFEMLRESGYFHIQATKPDTAGVTITQFSKLSVSDSHSDWIKRSNRS